MLKLNILLRNKTLFQQAVRKNHKNVKRATRSIKDRGLRQRATLFSDKQNESLETLDMDELEADFNSLGHSYGDHVGQMEAMKEQQKYLIVKQKYFKEKFPNFLTWSDKVQIKYLHGKDPEEWTVDKLSEGFPALPETIQKIVKGTWTKKNGTKTHNHDVSVQRNWTDFKAGKFELPPILEAHLHKFSNRSLNLRPADMPEQPRTERLLPGGEFSEIITSYQKLKEKTLNKPQIEGPPTIPNKNRMLTTSKFKDFKSDTKALSKLSPTEVTDDKELHFVDDDFLEDYPGHGEIITLKALKSKLIVDSELGEKLDADEKLIVAQKENQALTEVESIDLNMAKYVTNTGAVSTWSKKKDYSYLEYPEKIIIPQEKLKRGCTYKLNDCYYDDDGTFLYRVPGMH